MVQDNIYHYRALIRAALPPMIANSTVKALPQLFKFLRPINKTEMTDLIKSGDTRGFGATAIETTR